MVVPDAVAGKLFHMRSLVWTGLLIASSPVPLMVSGVSVTAADAPPYSIDLKGDFT
jgi:hypothetical protein